MAEIRRQFGSSRSTSTPARYHAIKVCAANRCRLCRIRHKRHTYASLLLQQGESVVYVKEQLGHASIQITVDTYGPLIPGANRAAVDRLDDAPTQPSASQAHPERLDDAATLSEMKELFEKCGVPDRNRTGLDYPRRPPNGEETDWQVDRRKLCPGLCPNACLPSINTGTYGETPRDIFPGLSR